MSNTIARILFASASLILTGTLAVASASAAEPEVRQTTVHYADLNLSNAAGRKTLEHRLNAAAERVCFENGARFQTMSCRTTALAKAHDDLRLAATTAS